MEKPAYIALLLIFLAGVILLGRDYETIPRLNFYSTKTRTCKRKSENLNSGKSSWWRNWRESEFALTKLNWLIGNSQLL